MVNVAMAYLISTIVLIAVVQATSRHASHHDVTELEHQVKRISPRLEPKTDKKFFGKDYPFDKRAVADKYYVFDHPYPAVQDGEDYDRDFVKDENSDNGHWDAQMHYDTLRAKIQKEKKKLQELKEKMDKEYNEWMDAKKKEKDEDEESQAAEKEISDAKKAADAAKKKVDDLEGGSGSPGGAIGDATKKVEDEMKDLEKCKEELAKAKERLKRLLKERDEAAKKAEEDKAKQEEKDAQEKKDKEAAEKEEEERARKLQEGGGKNETDAQQGLPGGPGGWDEEAWKKNLEKAKKEHAEAIKKYEKELTDVKKTEDQLARAAENLRKFRRPPYVDDDGGVYNVPNSAAFLPGALIAVLCVSLATHLS